MRTDYSRPSLSLQPRYSASNWHQDESEEEKQVDYSHLDIIAEVERIIERRLVRHTRTSGKWHCACPFPDCTSKHDAFTVWDRPVLEERGDGKREVHFWCGRCGRMGSLISLLRQYREAMTGEQLSWSEAARVLRIDPRTKQAMDEDAQSRSCQMTGSEKRRSLDEQRRKAGQAELAALDALYQRARAWLAAGQIVMKDGRCIPLDLPRAYLLSRGYTLAQASTLGIAYIPTMQEVPELADFVTRSWRGRLLFPLAGPHGVSGYAGRTLWRWTPGMTPEQHKQLLDAWNASHTELAQRVLRHNKTYLPAYYGYQDACHASTLLLVEGEFDAASMRLALTDLPDCAVCAFGKNIQARLVPENVLHVVLALDLDPAGQHALERLSADLQSRGMTVSVACPPAGKDWNDSHRLAGLTAIREEIARTCASLPTTNALLVPSISTLPVAGARPAEPPGYENGDVCLLCGRQIEYDEGAFYLCEDRESIFWGDMFCTPCWHQRSQSEQHSQSEECQPRDESSAPAQKTSEEQPAPGEAEASAEAQARSAFFAQVHRVFEGWPEPYIIVEEEQEQPGEHRRSQGSQDQPFTEAKTRCQKHRKPIRYGDELGGRYCDHTDCWERYRLMRHGARLGYPELSGVIDPRDYLADTSKEPLCHTASGLPVYPTRPPIIQTLIGASADAWHTYTTEQNYYEIDQAIKALTKRFSQVTIARPGEGQPAK